MDRNLKSDIRNELQALHQKFSRLERLVADPEPAVPADGLEIDLNAVVSELTYSLITSNATLANAPDGYGDHDLEGVKRLAAIYALVIQREQTQTMLDQEVVRRRQLEETVGIGRTPDRGAAPPMASDVDELNTALRVLLAQRDTERKDPEQRIVLNAGKLITPYVEKLKQTDLDPKQRAFLSIR